MAKFFFFFFFFFHTEQVVWVVAGHRNARASFFLAFIDLLIYSNAREILIEPEQELASVKTLP